MSSVESLAYKEAKEKAKQYDSSLRAGDPRFNRSVKVVSEDCKIVCHYDNAFALKDECWYYVFTEHNGYQVFHEEDHHIFQYQRLAIDSVEK